MIAELRTTLKHQINTTLDAVGMALSDQSITLDDNTVPLISNIQLLNLRKKWGGFMTLVLSKGNCYRYAANDPMKCLEEDHCENPGDVNTKNVTKDTCGDLLNGSQKDGMKIRPSTGCSLGDVEVALVVATTRKR